MRSIKRIVYYSLLIVVTFSFASCLTCEKKEYVFQLLDNKKVRLTIKYINIYSGLIDSTAEIKSDYEEMMNMWLNGEKLERDFPGAKKMKKKLYEENGMLNGEVTMEFDDLSKTKIFRYLNQGPYMFSMGSVNDDGENFHQSNGEYGDEKMPVVFWSEDTKTLRLTTKIATPDSTCVSMLKLWKIKTSKSGASTPFEDIINH